MKSLFLVGSILLAWVNVGSAAEDDAAAVRKCSERYAALIQKADKTGLDDILHSRYQGNNLLGARLDDSLDKSETIRHWVNRLHSYGAFAKLEDKVENIRVFGDTAIETGARYADSKEATWGGVRYVRVWMKDGQGWRLVHEQY